MTVEHIGRLWETRPDPVEFDEVFYLEMYPTIAEIVAQQGFRSGWHHYVLHGRAEGRLPVRPKTSSGDKQFAVDGQGADALDSAATQADATTHTDALPADRHNQAGFLTPTDLTSTSLPLQRVALIGSCVMEAWGFQERNPSGCRVDLITVNQLAELPDTSPEIIDSYDFQLISIPLTGILHDHALWRFAHIDIGAHERAFKEVCDRLELQLSTWMRWNKDRGLLTFVTNFFVPQQNMMGRLFPRYDIRNVEYFIDRLNEHLERLVLARRNAYVLDLDRIAASVGRRYTQDDSVVVMAHNGVMPFSPEDYTRIERVAPMSDHYEITWPELLPAIIWNEMLAMHRIVRQVDQVKLVVVDLDDTLWRGVSGDLDQVDAMMIEGWPMGVAEALLYLKKRGVLLAIISKNEDTRIHAIWQQIFGGRLSLEDFAAVRINWSPKSENMREILEGMNLLPRNVVFIDDNPVERAAMQLAFQDIRVLGRDPYYLRRILLWSAETQVPAVTSESSQRTKMVQAQFTRETHRKIMTRDDFLREAAPTVTILPIDNLTHSRFSRVVELINKTNQFNTTGRRWRAEEFENWLAGGGRIIAFEVADRFTAYGLVGVVLSNGNHIEQWVMSCRVLGYQIEQAVMAVVTTKLRELIPGAITGRLVKTDVNFPCRGLFSQCGFKEWGDTGDWVLDPDATVDVPAHVTITKPGDKATPQAM